MESKKRKAISPLVAVVALIGITLIISGMLVNYATRLTTGTLTQIKQCSDAGVIIQGARYDSSTGNLFLYVKNRGTVDLSFNVYIKKTNGEIIQVPDIYNTTAGQLSTFTITNPGVDIDEVTVQSIECMGVQDFISRRFITGMP